VDFLRLGKNWSLIPIMDDGWFLNTLICLINNGTLKFKKNSIKCLLSWNSNNGDEERSTDVGFDMKLPQRNFSHKVVLDALGDIH